MAREIIIRPILPRELEEYFRIRYQSAQEHNAALISELSRLEQLEMDEFDSSAIHIGSFKNDSLIGCIRLTVPQTKPIFPDKYLIVPPHSFSPKDNITLPSSRFLKGDDRKKLENYFLEQLQQGYKISETGRFIHLDDQFNPRLVRSMLCYVWAMNRFFGIDFCYFNTTWDHGRYYKRLFQCEELFPELQFETGASEAKFLLFANINLVPDKQKDLISDICKRFKASQSIAPFTINFELLKN